MKKKYILLVILTLCCFAVAVGQPVKLFSLTANAIAFGEYSGDKPTFNKRSEVNTDIDFYENLIKIDNTGESTFKLRNKKEYSNDTSAAFRYDATDKDGLECVVMFVIYADHSLLNIFYEDKNFYIRYYILKSNQP